MKMKINWLSAFIFAALCCSLTAATNSDTQKSDSSEEQKVNNATTAAKPKANVDKSDSVPKTSVDKNDDLPKTNVNTSEVLPKINVIESDLCKKCKCISNPNYSLMDCSNTKMNSLFSDEEWKILQNGDITFDTIRLEHNNITSIKEFPAYTVKNLYLAFNQIESIVDGAFANLTELTKLDLSYNKLTKKALDPDVFQGIYSAHDYLPLGKMIELNLGQNEIHSLNQDLFEHLPKLESLILSRNIFQVIDQNTVTAISGLSYLKTMDMSFMELSELPDALFHGPRDLETLILSGNLFDELPDDLHLATNLRELVLDENPIPSLQGEEVFDKLSALRYLSMAYMPELAEIGAGAFSELQNLTTLILSSNPKLSKIDVKAFSKNTTNPQILSYPPLEKLYLHNNNLTTLDRGMLERWDKITELDLSYNHWTCDCSNRWLIEVLMIQINNTHPTWAQDVICDQPNNWKGVPLLKLNSEESRLKCDIPAHGTESLFLIGLLVGILVCIPMVLGSIALWRRGCFGLNRDNSGANRALYSRANFNDELHI